MIDPPRLVGVGDRIVVAVKLTLIFLAIVGGSGHFQDDTSFKEVPGNLGKRALENAVTNGRDGLGTVFTWAGGNERDKVNNNLPSEEQRGRNVNSGNYF